MQKVIKLALGLALVTCAWTTQAKLNVPTYEELPNLAPVGVHQTACTRIANSFIRAHYKAIEVNNAFADKVIKQYLSLLDYNRSLFTQAEVDEIYQNRERIIRALLLCDLSYPYELYNTSLRKRFVKYKYFADTIKAAPLDLKSDDDVEITRKDADFFSDQAALEQEWLKELKNDYIIQLLNDKTEKEAQERLLRRYNAALSKLSQTRSEDVFSVFENSFASAIDPHTSYLSPDDSENFNDNLNLSLEGIGAVLTSEDEYTVINSILPGSPAEQTKKLKAKDKIVGVRQADGTYEDIIGWRLNEVVKKIKGPKGTKVTLDIERGEGSQLSNFSVDIIRDKVRLQDSEAKIEVKEHEGKKIAVLKIKSFYTNLHADILRELKRIKDEGEEISALVIDLRNNGGGLLPEATLSSGLFIKQGPIVLVRDARGNVLPQFDVDPDIAYDGPLVVLINRFSASSSEIMAAALRDYGRALVVGDTSFGKGTVQQSKPLSRVYDFNDSAFGSIHYTIAKFYRINGGSTQLKGVTPDLFLPSSIDKNEIGEGSEPNALPWDKISAVSYEAYLNIDAYVPELKRLSDARSAKNEAFKLIYNDTKRYQELKEKNLISVNLAKRQEMKKDDDAYRLNNTNTRLKLMGKPTIKKIKDLDEDFEFDDVILNETLAIASDFADAQKSKVYSAQNAPVLMRYQFTRDSLSEGTGMASPPGAAAMPARPKLASAPSALSAAPSTTTVAASSASSTATTVSSAASSSAAVATDELSLSDEATDMADEPSAQELQPRLSLREEILSKRHDLVVNPAGLTATASATTQSTSAPLEENTVANVEAVANADAVAHPDTVVNADTVVLLPNGMPYSPVTATGEVNNMASDGALLGPWRTINEDDTYLRVSDADFAKLIEDGERNSTSVHLQDAPYPSLLQQNATAVTENMAKGQIILRPLNK